MLTGVAECKLHRVLSSSIVLPVTVNKGLEFWTGSHAVTIYFYLFIYLLRPKAAQHNITITKNSRKHKKLKTRIHKN